MLGLQHDGQPRVRCAAVSAPEYPEAMPTGLTARYVTHDCDGETILESGYVLVPAAGPLNDEGRRPYLSTFGEVIYLRDDEIKAVIF